jgi:hypothetical protein
VAVLTLVEKKTLITRFLARCNVYADAKLAAYIEEYLASLHAGNTAEALSLADKISHWSAYKAFNRHAIGELETTALDEWLD